MIRPTRKKVPINVALAVALRQLGFEPHEVELDHDPALGLRNVNADGTDWDPPQHDARYLVWRPKAEHRVKTSGTKATTAGSDVQMIAKGKRLARDTEAFRLTETGRARTEGSARDAYEAEYRRRWRSLGLLIKAKLAAVADGIVEFETEFLPHIVLPTGETVAALARPAIALAYETGETPRLLPGPGGES